MANEEYRSLLIDQLYGRKKEGGKKNSEQLIGIIVMNGGGIPFYTRVFAF